MLGFDAFGAGLPTSFVSSSLRVPRQVVPNPLGGPGTVQSREGREVGRIEILQTRRDLQKTCVRRRSSDVLALLMVYERGQVQLSFWGAKPRSSKEYRHMFPVRLCSKKAPVACGYLLAI